MPTEDYLEQITERSDAVQVIVRDYDGSIRVFNIDNAKVVLRYVTKEGSYAYHPSNTKYSTGFRPDITKGDHLELAIITEDLIELEAE